MRKYVLLFLPRRQEGRPSCSDSKEKKKKEKETKRSLRGKGGKGCGRLCRGRIKVYFLSPKKKSRSARKKKLGSRGKGGKRTVKRYLNRKPPLRLLATGLVSRSSDRKASRLPSGSGPHRNAKRRGRRAKELNKGGEKREHERRGQDGSVYQASTRKKGEASRCTV